MGPRKIVNAQRSPNSSSQNYSKGPIAPKRSKHEPQADNTASESGNNQGTKGPILNPKKLQEQQKSAGGYVLPSDDSTAPLKLNTDIPQDDLNKPSLNAVEEGPISVEQTAQKTQEEPI